MTVQEYLSELNKVEKIACSSKWNRLFHNPSKYISVIVFNQLVYPRSGKERLTTTPLFFGKQMHIGLPASTDIYLTGGKSHDSEIRLARFLILNLKEGQSFLDIGTHYGYFSLLASALVGANGKVKGYEASASTYKVLKLNGGAANATFYHEAISDSEEPITFYEFPNLYSEYNSSSVEQFEKESWFAANRPEKVTVQAKTIDSITAQGFTPDIIKIDVEGAEFRVISGGKGYLNTNSPQLVMEYLSVERGNEEHQKAAALLQQMQYKPFVIDKNGNTIAIEDISRYLASKKLESDNIVFKK
jgi:FkbM family methyltransferase